MPFRRVSPDVSAPRRPETVSATRPFARLTCPRRRVCGCPQRVEVRDNEVSGGSFERWRPSDREKNLRPSVQQPVQFPKGALVAANPVRPISISAGAEPAPGCVIIRLTRHNSPWHAVSRGLHEKSTVSRTLGRFGAMR